MNPDPLLRARALVLADLAACGATGPEVVSLVEDAVAARRWWVREWPDGAAFVAGLLAQDVQDRIEDDGDHWPGCPRHPAGGHELRIEPELGPDPRWTCEQDGIEVARLGALPGRALPGGSHA